MLSIVLYVLAIILCGSIGGATGWAVSRWLGLAGVPGSLVALAIAMVVAVAAWLVGVAIYDARSRR
jgi:hypothetical protein